MSVPVSKRTLSDLEFFKNANQLRLSVTNLLLRDFALKDKVRNLQVLAGMRGMFCPRAAEIEAVSRIS